MNALPARADRNLTGHPVAASFSCPTRSDPSGLQDRWIPHRGGEEHVCSFCSSLSPSMFRELLLRCVTSSATDIEVFQPPNHQIVMLYCLYGSGDKRIFHFNKRHIDDSREGWIDEVGRLFERALFLTKRNGDEPK